MKNILSPKNIIKYLLAMTAIGIIIFGISAYHSCQKDYMRAAIRASLDLTADGIDNVQSVIDTLACVIGREDTLSESALIDTMKTLRDRYAFSFIVRTKADGYGVNHNGKKKIYLADRDYFIEGMKGRTTTSFIKQGRVDASSGFLITAVPIWKNGKIDGIIHGSYSTKLYFNAVAKKFDSKAACAFLLNSDGKVIASDRKSADGEDFSALSGAIAGIVSPACDSGDGVSVCDTKFGGADHFIAGAPVKFNNETLYLAVAMPHSEIPVNTDTLLQKGAIGFFVGGILFVSLIFLYFIIRNKEEAAMRRKQEDAERANLAKSEFLSRISHDIRTPLNGIIGMSNLALEETDIEQIKRDVSQTLTSSLFLSGLINDILDMSKIEAGKLELHPETYTIGDFENYIDAVIRPLVDRKQQSFSITINSTPGAVVVDKLRFNQVFFNLLSNAVKFTAPGGHIEMKLGTLTSREGRVTLEFSVKDDGVGISDDFQKHLFEPFSQEHQYNGPTEEGTGLGLAIVKHFVSIMNGSIAVKSALGHGTEFIVTLTLPIAEGRSETGGSTHVQLPSFDFSGCRILLCEDNEINKKIVVRMLEKTGAEVDAVSNGKLGAERFINSPAGYYSAVFMDIRMPVMNGLDATRLIRAQERADAASIPIIALTANAMDEDRAACMTAGMNAHIIKPIDRNALFTLLASMLADKTNRSGTQTSVD